MLQIEKYIISIIFIVTNIGLLILSYVYNERKLKNYDVKRFDQDIELHKYGKLNSYILFYYVINGFLCVFLIINLKFGNMIKINMDIFAIMNISLMWMAFVFTFAAVSVSYNNDSNFLISKKDIFLSYGVGDKLILMIISFVLLLFIYFVKVLKDIVNINFEIYTSLELSLLGKEIIYLLFFILVCIGVKLLIILCKLYFGSSTKKQELKMLKNLYNYRFGVINYNKELKVNNNSDLNYIDGYKYLIKNIYKCVKKYNVDSISVIKEYLNIDEYQMGDNNFIIKLFRKAFIIKNIKLIIFYLVLIVMEYIYTTNYLFLEFTIILSIIFFILYIIYIVYKYIDCACDNSKKLKMNIYIANTFRYDPVVVSLNDKKYHLFSMNFYRKSSMIKSFSSFIVYYRVLLRYLFEVQKSNKEIYKKIIKNFVHKYEKEIDSYCFLRGLVCYCIYFLFLEIRENDSKKIVNIFKDIFNENELEQMLNIMKMDYYDGDAEQYTEICTMLGKSNEFKKQKKRIVDAINGIIL